MLVDGVVEELGLDGRVEVVFSFIVLVLVFEGVVVFIWDFGGIFLVFFWLVVLCLILIDV